MEVNPPLDVMGLVQTAAERPAHELFACLAEYFRTNNPELRLRNLSVNRTQIMTTTFVLPDGVSMKDDRNHERFSR